MVPGEERALLIYDGDCAFCQLWVEAWRARTGNRVHYASSQEIASTFPDVPPEKYRRAVQLIDEDGSRHEGAAAVFRLLAKEPGRGWLLRLYEAPLVAPASDWAYRQIARHRDFFLRLTKRLWGQKIERPQYGLTSRLFLQALAVIYFLVFVSLVPQLPGLVGENGLLSAETYLSALHEHYGLAAYWLAPTFAWLAAHAGALQFMAICGALASLLAVGGVLLAPCFLFMWLLFLSLVAVGQDFLSLPGDALLLEVGFLAIFLVSFRRSRFYESRLTASPAILWLFRFLLFRLLFSSGVTKLVSGDPAWRNLTALAHLFETQPSPTLFAWFAGHLPLWIQKIAALGLLSFELLVPFLFLLPRRARAFAAALTAVFQIAAIMMGADGLTHWLILALCLLLVDDGHYARMFPKLFRPRRAVAVPASDPIRNATITAVVTLIGVLGFTHLAILFVRLPAPALFLATIAAPLRLSNDYGSFAATPTSRLEIVIEGSQDGLVWKEYVFRQKPGDVKRAPAMAVLFPSRLDWQMSVAALGASSEQPWVEHLLLRLLQGSRPVLSLFAANPFPEAPPRFVRAVLYDYRFTTAAERKKDGAWWRRRMKTDYLPIMTLDRSEPSI